LAILPGEGGPLGKNLWNTSIVLFAACALTVGHIFSHYRQALNIIVLLGFVFYAVALNVHISELHKLATRDELTGLLNRRAGEQALLVEINRAIRYGHLLAIVYLDFNNFKTVNDVLGHRYGDEILREGTRKIVTNVRLGDFVIRHGGDEIYIICPDTDQDGVNRLKENLLSAVRLEPTHKGESIPVTLSAGVVSFNGTSVQWQETNAEDLMRELLHRADEAMYVHKQQSREARAKRPQQAKIT